MGIRLCVRGFARVRPEWKTRSGVALHARRAKTIYFVDSINWSAGTLANRTTTTHKHQQPPAVTEVFHFIRPGSDVGVHHVVAIAGGEHEN